MTEPITYREAYERLHRAVQEWEANMPDYELDARGNQLIDEQYAIANALDVALVAGEANHTKVIIATIAAELGLPIFDSVDNLEKAILARLKASARADDGSGSGEDGT